MSASVMLTAELSAGIWGLLLIVELSAGISEEFCS
jgi:hypothetical protein